VLALGLPREGRGHGLRLPGDAPATAPRLPTSRATSSATATRYTAREGIVHVGCWAHARRHFFDAKPSAERDATEALGLVARLYAVERDAKDLSPAERAALRRQRAVPVLDAIRARLDAWHGDALPRSDFGKAVAYARAQWPTLVRYVGDGDVEIDNNALEREIRPIALGRKNWLFAGSYEGGRRAAVLYSVLASCKAAGAGPFEYLKDVLSAPDRKLTPRAWMAARASAPAKPR
jgi:hypothetical protein